MKYGIRIAVLAASIGLAGGWMAGTRANASPEYDPNNLSECWPTHDGDLAVITLQDKHLECSLLRRAGHGRRTLVERKTLAPESK